MSVFGRRRRVGEFVCVCLLEMTFQNVTKKKESIREKDGRFDDGCWCAQHRKYNNNTEQPRDEEEK